MAIPSKILIVDDDPDNVQLLSTLLKIEKYNFDFALNGNGALKKIEESFYCIVLLDIKMPGMDGITVLEKIKKYSPETLVILLTAYGTEDNIKNAKTLGAFDFLEKPIDNNLLLLKIKTAFQHFNVLLRDNKFKKSILLKFPYQSMIFSHREMKKIVNIIDKVAPTDESILILGESGTGKEIIARSIHLKSDRRNNKFKAINSGSLPETLLESELFGYMKGSFTDAKNDKIGYFEFCNGGTIFLDEIGDISPKMQLNLLRVLEEQKITRIGSTKSIDINTRVITATNKNLEQLMEEGKFRKDLFFRINTVRIDLPPLRNRKSDIPLLIDYFLAGHDITIAENASQVLINYDYPGNIRELENIIKHAILFQENNIIEVHDLPPYMIGKKNETSLTDLSDISWKEAKAFFEKKYIENILEKSKGNISHAARISGFDRAFLQKRIKFYNIKRKNFNHNKTSLLA